MHFIMEFNNKIKKYLEEKVMPIEMRLIFESFGCKSRTSCMYNGTAEKQGSFSSFIIVWDVTCK